jgi:hypothetical protein
MNARIKSTLFRLMGIEPPARSGVPIPLYISKPATAGITRRDASRLINLTSYKELLAQFVLPNSAQAVARSPYWKGVFREPVKTVLQRLKAQGILVEPVNPRARICFDRDESDLRMLCLEHGLQPTGGADDLVGRLLTIDPTGWLLGYLGELLQCSEFAERPMATRREAMLNSPLLDPELAGLFGQRDVDTQRYLLRDRIERNPSDNEVVWEMLKERAQHTARDGNLALCRNVHLAMANHLIRRNKKTQALQALCVVCIFDLCGARDRSDVPAEMRATYSRFDADRASLASWLVRRLRDLSSDMMLSTSQLQEIFLFVGSCLKVPATPRKLWMILQLALEGALDCNAEIYSSRAIRDLLH